MQNTLYKTRPHFSEIDRRACAELHVQFYLRQHMSFELVVPLQIQLYDRQMAAGRFCLLLFD